MAGITRRTFATGLAAAGGWPVAGSAQAQQGYPAGLTVKFLVGFPAGGAQDIVARIVADRLGALWKVATVVENIAGAGGNLGMDRVAKGPADGTQILHHPSGPRDQSVPLSPASPSIRRRTSSRSALVASLPNLLCVRKDLPVNSWPS